MPKYNYRIININKAVKDFFKMENFKTCYKILNMSYFDPQYFKRKIKVNRVVSRKIQNKLLAWKLDKEYYDGHRDNGYGGFLYDGRWLKLLPRIIKKYKLNNNSKILDLGCKKGFIMNDLKITSWL